MSATEAVRPIRVPIARYEVEEGPRLLIAVGRRDSCGDVAIDQLVDRPEDGSGRSYLVESNIQPGDHLRSLVADYKRQAAGARPLPDERRGARGAARPRQPRKGGALMSARRCIHTGVSLPECSCLSCNREKLRRYAPRLVAGS